MSQKIVTVNGRRNSDPSSVGVVLHAHHFASTRDLDGSRSGQLRRERHRKFDIRVLLDLAVHIEKDAARAYISSFSVNGSVRTG